MELTPNFANINLLVVFGATVVAMLLASIWYSPFIFGRIWMAAAGQSQADEIRNSPATMITAFILNFLIASMIAGILGVNKGGGTGAEFGALVAFCFVMPAMGATNLFERRPFPLIAVNIGFHMVSFTVMGFIIGTWN